jgi:hypothetical protein
MNRQSPPLLSGPASQRRSFFTSLSAGVASLAAVAVGSAAVAQGKSTPPARWEPARHEQDDWLDKPAKHRMVIDSTSADGFGEALAFATNYMRVNRSDYGLQDSDSTVIVVARHQSTPYAYSDAIWAKYGTTISEQAKFLDPKTKLPPKANVYMAGDYGSLLKNMGVTLDSLSKQGVQIAVCSLATHRFAGAIATATGANADAIFTELTTNLVSNSRMVPAGITAVNRAQERGYSLVTA